MILRPKQVILGPKQGVSSLSFGELRVGEILRPPSICQSMELIPMQAHNEPGNISYKGYKTYKLQIAPKWR